MISSIWEQRGRDGGESDERRAELVQFCSGIKRCEAQFEDGRAEFQVSVSDVVRGTRTASENVRGVMTGTLWTQELNPR